MQLLVSCSDDGTIRVVDALDQLSEGDQRRSRGRRRDRVAVTVAPEEYRPGQRNKKIKSVNMTSSGLLAAGSDRGEVYLWQLSLADLRKGVVRALGVYRKHSKILHHLEFSPDECSLFTGSVDGTASVWQLGGNLTDDKRLAHFSPV